VPQQSRGEVFGKRDVQHMLIIASGDRIRHFSIRPWHVGGVVAVLALFLVGYVGATAYLFMRDDLIAAARASQARVVGRYEERIASLRQQVDRARSEQAIDRKQVEDRIAKLYERQLLLTNRHGQLEPLIERARSAGLIGSQVPVPQPRPTNLAQADTADDALSAFDAIQKDPSATAKAGPPSPLVNAYVSTGLATAPRAIRSRLAEASPRAVAPEAADARVNQAVQQVSQSLRKIETDQADNVQDLTAQAIERASAIRTVLDKSGVPLEEASLTTGTVPEASGVGGPFIRLNDPDKFNAGLARLNQALDKLEGVRSEAEKLPFGRPMPQDIVTSPFGARSDPFLERMAFHPGVDLRAAPGTPVHATGAGVVTRAGPDGGYGNMVEIDHGDGVSSRYGHLSLVLAHVGEHVATGTVIGKAGSTGRSTGPHLHYEVRLDGHPVDPERFLNSGLALQALLRG